MTDPDKIKAALIAQARARGFDVAGVTKPDAVPEAQARLERFLADGAHGDMAWLATTADRRASPSALWPDVRSVIMFGMNDGPDEDPLAILPRRDRAAISVYAKGDDYHELIKARLKDIERQYRAQPVAVRHTAKFSYQVLAMESRRKAASRAVPH